MVLKEELHFSALMESPDSEDGTDGRPDSVFTRSTPSLEDGDTELYLMELTSPGLETPRVSIVHPQDASVRCIAKSDNSSTETLVSASLVSKATTQQTCNQLTEKRQGMHSSEEEKEVGSRWWLKLDGSNSSNREPRRLAEGVFAV